MDKETLLSELATKISTGELSREEVIGRFGPIVSENVAEKNLLSFFSVTKIMYVFGAVVVIIGVLIFGFQIWDDISSVGRIVITLGFGLLTAALGSLLLKNKPEDNIGLIFHVIGGVLIPGGAMVTLSELGTDFVSLWPVAITFGIVFTFYLLLNATHKNAVLTFFAIANGTAFMYLLVGALIENTFYSQDDVYAYLTMVVGVSYLLLGHAFRDGWNKKLVEILYFFGVAGFLGAALSQVFDSVFWQMLYILIVVGGLFLAVYLKNRSILVLSTLFLIAYVSYITSEYFADSIGWPITLVLLGFVFIGLGYVSININKKYIAL